MSDKPTIGVWEGRIIWHVDENGIFWWGSPADRAKRLAEERSRPLRIAADEAAKAELGDQLAHRAASGRRPSPRRSR